MFGPSAQAQTHAAHIKLMYIQKHDDSCNVRCVHRHSICISYEIYISQRIVCGCVAFTNTFESGGGILFTVLGSDFYPAP